MCIKIAGLDNVDAIPYLKGRLCFAQLAATAILEGGYDVVAVDLPPFIRPYAELIVGDFPAVKSLIIRMNSHRFLTIPFTPADAASVSILIPDIMRRGGKNPPSVCFVDDTDVIHYYDQLVGCEPLSFRDDYHVMAGGLKKYFEPSFAHWDNSWNCVDAEDRWYSEYRARQIASRNMELPDKGDRVLFICEASLYRLVAHLLEAGPPFGFSHLVNKWSPLSAVLIFEDPLDFWSHGQLDDYPAVTSAFVDALHTEGGSASFDKNRVFQEFLGKGLSVHGKCSVSIRRMLAFRRYLDTQLCADRRIIPEPVTQLFDAAVSCLGRDATTLLAEKLLQYPDISSDALYRFLSVYGDRMEVSDGEFEIPDLPARANMYGAGMKTVSSTLHPDRQKFVDRVRPKLTKNEVEQIGRSEGSVGVRWELKVDYDLYEQACDHARGLALRTSRQATMSPKRSLGELNGPINMKATIASIARGDPGVYINQRQSLRVTSETLDAGTPVAFLFCNNLEGHGHSSVHDSNLTQRFIELGNNHLISGDSPAPDQVYSVFTTFTNQTGICDGHITVCQLSSLIILYSRYMGTRRYDAVNERPDYLQCRSTPFGDPELKTFSQTEIGIAWGVKYSLDAMVVVGPDDWQPSADLWNYAKKHETKIILMRLSNFSNEFINRIKIGHTISTPLKKHPNRDRIIERFIPD